MDLDFDYNDLDGWKNYFLDLKVLYESSYLFALREFYDKILAGKQFSSIFIEHPALFYPQKVEGSEKEDENFILKIYGGIENMMEIRTSYESLITFVKNGNPLPETLFKSYVPLPYYLTDLKNTINNILSSLNIHIEPKNIELKFKSEQDLLEIREKMIDEIKILLKYFPAYNSRALFIFTLSHNNNLEYLLSQYPELKDETIRFLGFNYKKNEYGLNIVTDFSFKYNSLFNNIANLYNIGVFLGISNFPDLGKDIIDITKNAIESLPEKNKVLFFNILNEIKKYSSSYYGEEKFKSVEAISNYFNIFYTEIINLLQPFFFIGALKINPEYNYIEGFGKWLEVYK